MTIIPITRKVFAVGVDLGKSAESTAMAVVQRKNPENWDALTDCPRDEAEFHVSYLKRFPPSTHHIDTAGNLSELLKSDALTQSKEKTARNTIRDIDLTVELVIDQTAVGPPVVDMILRRVGRNARRVVISGTHTESYSNGLYHTPKPILIAGLEVLLETKRLKIADSLPELQLLIDELLHYRARKTTNATLTASPWREQSSDDLVFALALACWRLQEPGFSYEFI